MAFKKLELIFYIKTSPLMITPPPSTIFSTLKVRVKLAHIIPK